MTYHLIIDDTQRALLVKALATAGPVGVDAEENEELGLLLGMFVGLPVAQVDNRPGTLLHDFTA